MGKPQQKRKDNTKNNYFKQMINKYGPNFIDEKKMEKGGLMNEPPRVFRDLVRNRIDFSKETEYFRHPDFIVALLNNALENFRYYSVLYNAMGAYFNQRQLTMGNNPINSDEHETYIRVKNSLELYKELYDSLYNFQITGNIDWLIRIPFNITNKNLANLIV